MFTLESLASAYNSAPRDAKNEKPISLVGLLVSEIKKDPLAVLECKEPGALGIALFSVCFELLGKESKTSKDYTIFLMLAFWCLFKAHKAKPDELVITTNLNLLWMTNTSAIVQYFQSGAMLKYNMMDPLASNSEFSFVYDKLDVLKYELNNGTLDKHEDYEEYCEIFIIGIEEVFKQVKKVVNK
jgi:hypothetical protein